MANVETFTAGITGNDYHYPEGFLCPSALTLLYRHCTHHDSLDEVFARPSTKLPSLGFKRYDFLSDGSGPRLISRNNRFAKI